MALNKHMAAAVAEITDDIALLKREKPTAQTKEEIKSLKAARDTIDALYGGPDPEKPVGNGKNGKHGKYVYGGNALAVAAGMRELTALGLAAMVGFSLGAASKCLRRWEADGWVRKVKHGLYVRTAKFPATVVPRA